MGHLSVTSTGHQWVSAAIGMHKSCVFTIPMKEKSAENVMQAYLSNIFVHKGGNIAILSDNRTEFKNNALSEACDQLTIKRIFSTPFYTQWNSRIKIMHNSLKRTLTKFLESSDLEWDELLPFVCYCYNIFPRRNGIELSSLSCLVMSQWKTG